MDLIILSVGLTVLLARDVYKTVRRKRKEKKLRKKLQAAAALNGVADEEGDQYVSDSRSRTIGRPIAAPRTSRNHPDRPVTSRTNGSRSGRGNGNGNGSGTRRGRGRYRRLRTSRDGEQYYYRHGLDSDEDEERTVDHYQSEYGRMQTPPPAYEPGPNPPPVASGSEYPLPPVFEHAYTEGATGQVAEAQRKADGAEILARHGEESCIAFSDERLTGVFVIFRSKAAYVSRACLNPVLESQPLAQ
ncbi:hypothetical protein EST38_g7330 [Candolleomyces aberdarensis]|uniref:Uncharacterized protein n=1 Tax=Candolleomyces aberdarensis TaxID=2316362 RepID=A0A4Q2DFV5_9AGAR|nr:hypothetical protein EST38_g7330 [Candolleomyces aberdarensis]